LVTFIVYDKNLNTEYVYILNTQHYN